MGFWLSLHPAVSPVDRLRDLTIKYWAAILEFVEQVLMLADTITGLRIR